MSNLRSLSKINRISFDTIQNFMGGVLQSEDDFEKMMAYINKFHLPFKNLYPAGTLEYKQYDLIFRGFIAREYADYIRDRYPPQPFTPNVRDILNRGIKEYERRMNIIDPYMLQVDSDSPTKVYLDNGYYNFCELKEELKKKVHIRVELNDVNLRVPLFMKPNTVYVFSGGLARMLGFDSPNSTRGNIINANPNNELVEEIRAHFNTLI